MHTKQLQRTTKTAAGPRLASARTPLAAQPRHCLSASSRRREELAQARATAGQWRSTRSRPQPAQATRCFWDSTHAHPWLHSPKSAILGDRPRAGGRGPNWSTAGPQDRHFPPVGSKARRNRSPGARERTGFPPKPIKQLQEEGRRPRPAQELVGKRRLWPEKRIERRSCTRPAAEPQQSSAASGPRNGEKSPGERKKSARWLGVPPTDSWGLDLPSMNRRWEVK